MQTIIQTLEHTFIIYGEININDSKSQAAVQESCSIKLYHMMDCDLDNKSSKCNQEMLQSQITMTRTGRDQSTDKKRRSVHIKARTQLLPQRKNCKTRKDTKSYTTQLDQASDVCKA